MALRVQLGPTLWAAFILGFALGGFFDGILLHQVLQWHHFLSFVGGQNVRDIRTQILADGLFHVAVYVITAAGLWMLWRSRSDSSVTSDRRFLGAVLLGFGIWQFADVVLFHWVIGIHHIRVDVPNPITWDVGWLLIIGVPPTAGGLLLLRSGDSNRGGGRFLAREGIAVVVVIAALLSTVPMAGQQFTTVLLRPGVGPGRALELAAAVDGRLVWADTSGEVAVLEGNRNVNPLRLYANGALLVSTSMVGSGCLIWPRAGRSVPSAS
jgi:uncharacterized membrane protein